MKIKEFLMYYVLPPVIKLILFIVGKTLRLSEHGNAELSPRKRKKEAVIFAFWHSRLITSLYYYRNKSITAIMSLGRDGEFIARVGRGFGFSSIRGSTSRDGFRALLEAKHLLQEGRYLAITPDGPRGPKQIVQGGVIYLSKISGVPIAPFSFDISGKWVLNSWDNFIIPKPFSRGVFVWGEEITVPADADEKVIEEKRVKLEKELNRLTEEAAKLCR